MSAFFVTATGTDIGKTFVTAGLIRHLRKEGRAASALKPLVTGFDIATSALSDPGLLLDAMDEKLTPEAFDRISPWRFAAPLSPDMAAAREGRAVEYDALIAFCREAMQTKDTLFIEGVGGAMVPLDTRHTVLDWMEALALPVIVVAGSYLGTISHTLTALDTLARAKLTIAALVINDTPSDIPIADTIASISRFTPDVPIAAIPRVKHWLDAREQFAALWRILA